MPLEQKPSWVQRYGFQRPFFVCCIFLSVHALLCAVQLWAYKRPIAGTQVPVCTQTSAATTATAATADATVAATADAVSSERMSDSRILQHATARAATSPVQYEAQGQHLLLDVYNTADAALLDDSAALLEVMTALIIALDMTILGTVAKQLSPRGVSITIALKESHFTVHTYPEVRTAFVDLFTCGSTALLPHLQRLAAIFGADIEDTANTKWSLVKRGVQHAHKINDLDFELGFLQSEKHLLHSSVSPYQQVSLWAFRNDEYWGLFNSGSEWTNTLFLDGSLQSSTKDEHVYHESLVHPAMLAHSSGARRVAILGGGEGGALREVLKYKSVQHVEMIELDREVVNVAKQRLSQLHDCSFLLRSSSSSSNSNSNSKNNGVSSDSRSKNGGSSSSSSDVVFSCFDDPRVHVRYADAVEYFALRAASRKGKSCRQSQAKPAQSKKKQQLQQQQQQQMKKKKRSNQRNRKRSSRFTATNRQLSASLHQQQQQLQDDAAIDDDNGFDVIIVDLFDPEDNRQDLVQKLYSKSTLASIVCSLRRDGVLITQLGETPSALAPRFQMEERDFAARKLRILEDLSELLPEELSMPSQLFLFSTFVESFRADWSFALFFTSTNGPSNFQRNAARADLTIRQRVLQSALPLRYVDGAVLDVYSRLPREWQDAFCYQKQRPAICDFFNIRSQEDYSSRSISGSISTSGSNIDSGNGWEPMVALQPSTMHTDLGEANRWETVAAVDIPQWTDLGLYDAATSIRLSLEEYHLLEKFVETTKSKEYAAYLDMINRYAYECNDANGQYIYCSLDSKNTFVNHGCDQSVTNTGSVDYPALALPKSTSAAAADVMTDELDEVGDFNLVMQRHERRYCAMSLSLRAIKKGEPIMEDYGLFGDSWKPPAEWCNGTTKSGTAAL